VSYNTINDRDYYRGGSGIEEKIKKKEEEEKWCVFE